MTEDEIRELNRQVRALREEMDDRERARHGRDYHPERPWARTAPILFVLGLGMVLGAPMDGVLVAILMAVWWR